MTISINRRSFGALMGAFATSNLAGRGTLTQSGGSVRLIWWGNPERDRRTNAVVDL